MANRDLIHLEEQRVHLKYLLAEINLNPDFRSAIERHLARVEELIAEIKKLRLNRETTTGEVSH
jgi:hypothetical protein